MHQRALVLALMAAGALLPGTAQAADDCTQMFVYSVNQFCRTLSNGFSQCQPVGMVGPAPNCAKPGLPPIMPVPLAPPVLQAPGAFNYAAPSPVPGGAAPGAVQPMHAPAVPAAAPVAAATPPATVKPKMPASATAPIAATPSAPVAVVTPVQVALPAPVAVPAPAPVVAPTPALVVVAPASKQEAVVAPIAAPAPVASMPAAPAPVAAAPAVVAAPAAAQPTPPAQPAPVASAPASTPVEPAMPPSITLEDGLAHFGFNRAELSGPSRAELDVWLKQPLPKGKTLRVTGHADRIGPASYNLKLSGRRAETVKKYLVGKGIAGQDIKVVAKGETEPVKHCKGGASKATIDCLAPNRRVEIDPE